MDFRPVGGIGNGDIFAQPFIDVKKLNPNALNPNLDKERRRKTIYDEAMKELDSLEGMEVAKGKIKDALALATTFKAREKHNLKNSEHALHMIFKGNAGTGKTTLARIVGKLFYGAGLLKKGDYKETRSDRDRNPFSPSSNDSKPVGEIPFVECSNSDITSCYWGEDEKNLKKRFDEANGGVLFIDEAYSLITYSRYSAVDKLSAVLVQEMENRRNNVCVIGAGYPDEMEEFLQYNTGLASRFATVIDFPDYSVEALIKIANSMAKDRDYRLTDNYILALSERLEKERLTKYFGNARTVRNIIEESIRKQAKRVYETYGDNPSRQDLTVLKKVDLEEFKITIHKTRNSSIMEFKDMMNKGFQGEVTADNKLHAPRSGR
jgi:stage V sporulation protein K